MADLAAFLRSLLNRGRGLLSPESFELMATPAIEADDGWWYGLGLELRTRDGRQEIRHGGSMPGFGSDDARRPRLGPRSRRRGQLDRRAGPPGRHRRGRSSSSTATARCRRSPIRSRSRTRRTTRACTWATPAASRSSPTATTCSWTENRSSRAAATASSSTARSSRASFSASSATVTVSSVRRTERTRIDARGSPRPNRAPSRPSGAPIRGTTGPTAPGTRTSASSCATASWSSIFPWGLELTLEPLPDGSFRAGDEWSPERLRFEAIVDGRRTARRLHGRARTTGMAPR